jgi:hypothetical protein
MYSRPPKRIFALRVFDPLHALAVFLKSVSNGRERGCLATFLTSDSCVSRRRAVPQLFVTDFALFLLREVVCIR